MKGVDACVLGVDWKSLSASLLTVKQQCYTLKAG